MQKLLRSMTAPSGAKPASHNYLSMDFGRSTFFVLPGTDIIDPSHAPGHIDLHRGGDDGGAAVNGQDEKRGPTEVHVEVAVIAGEIVYGIFVTDQCSTDVMI